MVIQLLSDLNINEHEMIAFSEFKVLVLTQKEFQIPAQVPTQEEETQILIQEEPQAPIPK
ncbi:26396_t:CDS:2 [Gigaspora margarita]|uniref:26396_t:CDS:1 n=1 Tax=Gigaspora margarita TaxID=4874 RepID=A0ABN7VCS8_GIGMA|nr:26396_t:CDS:2 [Gigaspora margarita]